MTWSGMRPSEFAVQVVKDCEEHTKKIIIKGFQSVIVMSPVMDGAFRGNHRISINSKDQSFNPQKLDLSGAATMSVELQKLLTFRLGNYVCIQNNAPYAKRLENGYSKQAPAGIYSIAFQTMSTQ